MEKGQEGVSGDVVADRVMVTPKISTSQPPKPVDVLLYIAKGTLRFDSATDAELPGEGQGNHKDPQRGRGSQMRRSEG